MVASQNPAVGWKLSAAGSTWMQIENHPLLAISVCLFPTDLCGGKHCWFLKHLFRNRPAADSPFPDSLLFDHMFHIAHSHLAPLNITCLLVQL